VVAEEWEQIISQKEIDATSERESHFRSIIAWCAGKAAFDKLYDYKAERDEAWRGSQDYRQAFDYTLQLNERRRKRRRATNAVARTPG
jgi:hypothetical protein